MPQCRLAIRCAEPLLPREEPATSNPLEPLEAVLQSASQGSTLRSKIVTAGWVCIPLIAGPVMGVLRPSECGLPVPLDTVSAVLGWTYFIAWSLSFYPQRETPAPRARAWSRVATATAEGCVHYQHRWPTTCPPLVPQSITTSSASLWSGSVWTSSSSTC